MNDLDNEIFQVLQSTKTFVVKMAPAHNWLRSRSKFYYSWSLRTYSRVVHWVIFILFVAISPLSALLFNKPNDDNHAFALGGETFSYNKWITPSPTASKITGLYEIDANNFFITGLNATLAKGSKVSSELGWEAEGNISWISYAIDTTEHLRDVYAPTPTNTWAVGDNGKIYKYNSAGGTWQSQVDAQDRLLNASTTIDLTGIRLNSISGYGSNVWIAGDSATFLYYNGTTWSRVDQSGLGNISNGLCDISVGTDNTAVVIGSTDGASPVPIIKYDGTSWSRMEDTYDLNFGFPGDCWGDQGANRFYGLYVSDSNHIWISQNLGAGGGTIPVAGPEGEELPAVPGMGCSYSEVGLIWEYDPTFTPIPGLERYRRPWILRTPQDAANDCSYVDNITKTVITSGMRKNIGTEEEPNYQYRMSGVGSSSPYSVFGTVNGWNVGTTAVVSAGSDTKTNYGGWVSNYSNGFFISNSSDILSYKVGATTRALALKIPRAGGNLRLTANGKRAVYRTPDGLSLNFFDNGAYSTIPVNGLWYSNFINNDQILFSGNGSIVRHTISSAQNETLIAGSTNVFGRSANVGGLYIFPTQTPESKSGLTLYEEGVSTYWEIPEGYSAFPQKMAVASDCVWFITSGKYIYRFSLTNHTWNFYEVAGIDSYSGITNSGQKIYVSSGSKIYSFNSSQNQFEIFQDFMEGNAIKDLSSIDDDHIYALLTTTVEDEDYTNLSRYNGASWSNIPILEGNFINNLISTIDEEGDIYNYFAGISNSLTYLGYNYSPKGAFATNLAVKAPGQNFSENEGLSGTAAKLRAGENFCLSVYAVGHQGEYDYKIDGTNATTVEVVSTDPSDNDPFYKVLSGGMSDNPETSTCEGVLITNPHKNDHRSPPYWRYTVSDNNNVLSSASVDIMVGAGRAASFTAAKDYSENAKPGQSRRYRIKLFDAHGNVADNNSNKVFTLTGPDHGRFSAAENGPWAATSTVTVPSGSSEISFYYLDYLKGASQITVSGMSSSSTIDVTTNQGDIDPYVSRATADPDVLYVGENSNLKAILKDTSGQTVEDKEIQFHSSRFEDLITNPTASTDQNGEASGSITSDTAGDLTVSVLDATDSVWLVDRPSIRFMARPIVPTPTIPFATPTPTPTPTPNTPQTPKDVESAFPSMSASVLISDKTRIQKGESTDIRVIALDINNTPIPGLTAKLDYNRTYGGLVPLSGLTDEQGKVKFTFTAGEKTGRIEFIGVLGEQRVNNTLSIEIYQDNIITKIAEVLQQSVQAQTIAKVLSPVVFTTTTIGLLPLIANVLGGAPTAIHFVTYSFSIGLEALGIRRRRKNWGRVYDSTTGKSIDMALVRLFDANSLNLVATMVTDPRGRYSFQPPPGSYVISVSKSGFIFPTEIFAKYGIKTIESKSSHFYKHYLGQTVHVDSNNTVLNIEVPLDPVKGKASAWVKIKVFSEDLFELLLHYLNVMFVPVLIFGMIAAAFSATVIPTQRNIVIFALYYFVATSYAIGKYVKAAHYGLVYDSRTKKPVTDAVVSIFEKAHNTLKETRITDRFGHFQIAALPGEYYLKVDKEGWVFPSEKINKKNVIDKKFKNLYFGDVIRIKEMSFIKVSIPIDDKKPKRKKR